MPTMTDADRMVIARVSNSLHGMRTNLTELFPEREWLIHQILIALIAGRNVLIWGRHGTAKSLIADTVFASVVGPGMNGETKQVFTIQLDNETTKDALIGPPNIPLLEKGQLEPMIEGYLPSAHFAFLDEIFDAPGVLRTANDILNERELREGRLNIRVPLLTAIATSNRQPDQLIEMYPTLQLDAVSDRFLCVSRVENLKEDSGVDRMLTYYLDGVHGRALPSTVQFADIQRVVEIIRRTNQFPSRLYQAVYRSVIQGYRALLKAKLGKEISDRRVAWLTQVVEASAVLSGRGDLYFDDLGSVALGLAESPIDPEIEIFTKVSRPLIDEAKKAHTERVDERERAKLEQIETDLKVLDRRVQQTKSWITSPTKVGETITALANLDTELKAIKPQLDVNEQWRLRLIKQVGDVQSSALARVSGGSAGGGAMP